MRILSIIALLSISFASAQRCETVPQSLSEAEYFLRTDEIDSTCFELFRDLILNPVDPRREGWRRIRTLLAEQDGVVFPSPADLAMLPDSTAIDTIIARFPHLEPFKSYIAFDLNTSKSPYNGLADLKISGTMTEPQPRTTGRGAIRSHRTGSFAELKIEDRAGSLQLTAREITGQFAKQKLELTAGNFPTQKRSLLWGYFKNSPGSSEEAVLLGTGSDWNGFAASFTLQKFALRSFIHTARDESAQAFSAEYLGKRFAPELTIFRSIRTDTGIIGSFAIRDSADRFRIESNFETDGGAAIAITANLFDAKNRGSLELWHCSERYQPEFSSRVQQTIRRYDSAGTITGIASHWIQRGVLVHGETRISGELVPAGGRTDFSATVSIPRLLSISLRNHIAYEKTDSDKRSFYENRIKIQPQSARLLFPIAQENRFDQNGWNQSSAIAGLSLIHPTLKPETEFRVKWYREQPVQPEWRISAIHRFYTRGSSSFSLTVPLAEPERVVLYGRATLLF